MMTYPERLRELLSLGEQLLTTPEKVYMADWTKGATLPHYCGAIHCLGGWAAVHDVFEKDGLQLFGGSPEYQGWSGFNAMSRFFGISYEAARDIFGSPTLEEALMRLRGVMVEYAQ